MSAVTAHKQGFLRVCRVFVPLSAWLPRRGVLALHAVIDPLRQRFEMFSLPHQFREQHHRIYVRISPPRYAGTPVSPPFDEPAFFSRGGSLSMPLQ